MGELKHNTSLESGVDLANDLMPIIKAIETNSDEPVKWWAGFMGTIVGAAGASIGPEAVMVIGEIVKDAVERITQERTH